MTIAIMGFIVAAGTWFSIYWREILVVLAGISFILIKVMNHRSKRTDFRVSIWDLYQVIEYAIVILLLLKGLDWI